MITKEEIVSESVEQIRERIVTTTDAGFHASHASRVTLDSVFSGKFIRTMYLGGIGTDPQFRREGLVRQVIQNSFALARERGWLVSLLHPFSFAYYRKFGYERVSDTIICDFPMSALNHIPRYADLVPYQEQNVSDLLALYEDFSLKRNLPFRRSSLNEFVRHEKSVYLDYAANGHLEGYLILEGQNHYDGVNRMDSDNLHVWEYAYTDRNALLRLLGFLRMYEGEFDTIRIHDIGMAPEVDFALGHYQHTKYEIRPDVSARILDTEGMLKANAYPQAPGHFILRVNDELPTVAGVFEVEYEKGIAEVKRTATDKWEISVGPTALARLLYGSVQADAETMRFQPDVEIQGDTEDFFRAFPRRKNGIFNHF